MPTRPSERAPYIFDSFHIISFSSLLSSILPSFLLPPIETRGNQDGGHHSLDVARSFVVSPPTHPVARTYALLSHQSKTKQNGVLSSTKIVSSSKKLRLPSMNVRGGRLPPPQSPFPFPPPPSADLFHPPRHRRHPSLSSSSFRRVARDANGGRKSLARCQIKTGSVVQSQGSCAQGGQS